MHGPRKAVFRASHRLPADALAKPAQYIFCPKYPTLKPVAPGRALACHKCGTASRSAPSLSHNDGMRTYHAAIALAVTVLALAAWPDPDASHTGMSDEGKPTPAFMVTKDTSRAAELLLPDATQDTATLALHRWIGKNIRGRQTFTVQVVRAQDADTVVCRATYYADEQTAKTETGRSIGAGSWPYTHVECPDRTTP